MCRIALFWSLISVAAFAQNGSLSAAEQAIELNAVKEYAQNYNRNVPNYTCTQVIQRTMLGRGRLNGIGLRQQDVIESQLSLFDGKEIHRITKIDGRPVRNPEAQPPSGAVSRGEFGSLLQVLFDPETGADIHWDRTTTLNGRRMQVFAFRVPQPKGYGLVETNRTLFVAYRGLLYADDQTKAVIRIQMNCIDIPSDSEYKSVDLTLDYKPTQVAGQEFTLPFHYRLHVRKSDGVSTNEADYRAYRRFGAEATITFGGGPK